MVESFFIKNAKPVTTKIGLYPGYFPWNFTKYVQ